MNTLRLENINLHAPYRVLQDPERHNNFYFVSDSGARFDRKQVFSAFAAPKFASFRNSSYLCKLKGTYLGWEPRLVRQATH